MGKLLTLLIVAIVLVLLIKKLRRGGSDAPPRPRRGDRVERMVVCSYCGVHVPEGESVSAGGRVYCCDEHRRLGG